MNVKTFLFGGDWSFDGGFPTCIEGFHCLSTYHEPETYISFDQFNWTIEALLLDSGWNDDERRCGDRGEKGVRMFELPTQETIKEWYVTKYLNWRWEDLETVMIDEFREELHCDEISKTEFLTEYVKKDPSIVAYMRSEYQIPEKGETILTLLNINHL